METIIKRAVNGKYMPENAIEFSGANDGKLVKDGKPTIHGWSVWNMESGSSFCVPHSEIVLDPLFWQSLGKACGWEKTRSMYNCTNSECSYANDMELESILDGYCTRCGHKRTEFQKDFKQWLVRAKTFHEINLTEGWTSAIEYLESLITKDTQHGKH